MQIKPKITVITLTFNSAKYIERNIRSVYNQTYANWEHLILDCGSNDKTLSVIKKNLHDRLRLVETGYCSVPTARNIAISHARGDLIAILDSDDVSSLERLALTDKYFSENGKLVALGGWLEVLNERYQKKKILKFPADSKDLRILLDVGVNPMPHSTLAFRRDKFEEVGMYDVSMEKAEDYDLILRLSMVGSIQNAEVVFSQYLARNDSHSFIHKPMGRTTQFYKWNALQKFKPISALRSEQLKNELNIDVRFLKIAVKILFLNIFNLNHKTIILIIKRIQFLLIKIIGFIINNEK